MLRVSMKNDSRSGRKRSTGLILALVLPVLLLGQACDSGSGGGNPAELCIEFVGDNAPTPGTVTAQEVETSPCNLVEIDIVAMNVDDVFAFQSVVNYDPDTAAFLGFSLVDSALEGDLDAGTNADVTVDAEENVFGVVTIGATRIGPEGVDIVGEGILVKLAFARFSIDGRSGEFELDTNCLLNSATPPVPITSVTCSGGTLAVR